MGLRPRRRRVLMTWGAARRPNVKAQLNADEGSLEGAFFL